MENRKKLPECEEMIMAVLWQGKKDLLLEEVRTEVERCFGKEWKVQTVATFLTRLQKKGFISIYRPYRNSHYHPEIGLDEYRHMKLSEIGRILFNGDNAKMAEFVEKMKNE